MSKTRSLGLASFAAAISLSATGCSTAPGPTDLVPGAASVVSVEDGSTLVLAQNRDEHRVQLADVRAPAMGSGGSPSSCGAWQARARLEGMVPAGSDVDVLSVTGGSASIEAGGLDPARQLAYEGLVAASDDGPYASLAENARQHGIGSWPKCPSMTP